MSPYILYGGRFTRALIVEMVMAEGEIAYQLREVDIVEQEHRAPAFLAINPAGRVPALITPEGAILYETHAINLYLAERHGLTQLAPGPGEPERGLFLSGLFHLTDELEPVMKAYFYPHRTALRTEDSPAMKRRSLEIALERLGVIDRRLRDGGPYHLGERYSLVDLTMTYWTAYLDHGGALEPYPAVRRCAELVIARPKLRGRFAELRAMRADYAGMQARGAGVE